MSAAPIPPRALSGIGRIGVWDNGPEPCCRALPSLSHTEAIPTLWHVLHLINSDWLKTAAECSQPQGVDESEMLFWQIDAFDGIKP